MFTKEDLGSILGMIEFTWQNGGVRSEAQAMAVHNLKAKVQQLLNPRPVTAPAPEKKKKGDCCGDEKKEEKKPDGPPKAKEVPKKAEG